MSKKILSLLLVLVANFVHAGTYEDMMKAVSIDDVNDVVRLLKRGVDVDTTDAEGNTLLMIAARDGQEALVDLFIAQRPKMNARNIAGDSALRLAAFAGHLGIVKKLVTAGAKVNSTSWTPLIYAAFNGHVEIVRYLLGNGADINAASENGSTALMMAARNGHGPVVQVLLAKHADPRLTNENGETALDLAKKSGRNDNIPQLLTGALANQGK